MPQKSNTSTYAGQLIESILGIRREIHPWDRLISLLTFATWLQYPHDLSVVRQGRVLAAANVMLYRRMSESAKRSLAEAELDYAIVAPLLLSPPELGNFRANFELIQHTLFDSASIAEFFTISPDEIKPRRPPSFNRAMHFIENGGFVDDPDLPEDQRTGHQASRTTLKKSWSTHAVCGPFVAAVDGVNLERLLDLVPDEQESIADGLAILEDRQCLSEYFGIARFIQERMVKFLDDRSKARFSFVSFPKQLKPIQPALAPLKPHQTAILQSYKILSSY